MNARNVLLAVIVVAALGAGLLLVVVQSGLFAAPVAWHGTFLDPAIPAADFTLVDQAGRPFTLSTQRGNVVLLFFSYTYCPDVCPLTMAKFARVQPMLGEEAAQVRFVLVTVDPERDSPERLAEYLAQWDAEVTGLTGDMETLRSVWRAYAVHVAKAADYDRTGDIDHTSRIYLIDPQGDWLLLFRDDVDPGDLVQDVRRALAR